MKEKDQKSSDFLGVDIDKEVEEVVEEIKEEVKEEKLEKIESLLIDDLDNVMKRVVELEKEKELNPDVIHEEDAGSISIKGEPHMVIDNEYVPYKKAQVILQARKVVREWLKLERLKKDIINNEK